MEGSLFEVGLRDGLQSEKQILTLDQKLKLLRMLLDAGVKELELGSMVRPDRIPQLADTAEFIAKANEEHKAKREDLLFWAFVPNIKGYERARPLRLNGVSVFYACSDTFCKKNVNRGQNEILEELAKLQALVGKDGLKSRAYLSTIVHCPYEGPIPEEKVVEECHKLLDLGFDEIALSDTTGHARPAQISSLCGKVMKKSDSTSWALHLHDTRGMAIANVAAGLLAGITRFDASIAGLGGCPYAPGASGNLASEDLLYLFWGGDPAQEVVSLEKLAKAGRFVESCLGRKLSSKVLRSMDNDELA